MAAQHSPALRLRGAALALALLLAPAFAGSELSATSYVMVEDEDLAAGASRIVVGSVTGIDHGSNGGFYTDYAVRVDRLLKGEDPGPAVMVRVLGGEGLEQDELRVIGAPRWSVGDQTLLFLDDELDGAYPLHQFFLGAFRRVAGASGTLAVRDLSEAEELALPGRTASASSLGRDFEAFADWLSASAEGVATEPTYFRSAPENGIAKVESAYTTLGGETVRWFEFDKGGYVTYFADKNGMNGTAADVFGMTSRVLQAWSGVEGAKVSLRFGGTTTIGKPLSTSDRLNGILFNDPYGEVSGTFDCAKGGVLAIGGVKRSAGSKSFANGSAGQIVEGDVVVNDGAACFFERNGGLDGEEVLGHEIGHSLGFGHSKDKAALMWASAKGNARGCAFGADDISGLYFLYPGAPGLQANPGTLSLSAAKYSGGEGGAVSVTVQRDGGSTGAASVRIRTRNGTAKAPADFVAKDETLSWAHGDSAPRTVTLALAGDAAKEAAETFRVELLAASGAPMGTIANAVVTITDGKGGAAAGAGAGLLGLASTGAGVEESAKIATLTVERKGGGAGAVTVVWRTLDASAKAGADYVTARGVLRWAAGDVKPKTLSVRLLDDKVAESPESFLVKLLRATGGARLGEIATTAVKIQDNDR